MAVSVRFYEVLGLAIIDPAMKDLDVAARTDERTFHDVGGPWSLAMGRQESLPQPMLLLEYQ